MATTIRLKRIGAKQEASFRIVVTDSREGTSGASIERLGLYNPRTQPSIIRLNAGRTLYWLHEGAQPSDTVRALLRKTGVWKQFQEGVTADAIEEEIVQLGPPAGGQGTSQRPMPTDRAPQAKEEPAAEAGEEPAAEAGEEPVAEVAEEPAAEAAEAPAPQAKEEPAAEVAEEADGDDKA